jgi:hypothetical protein
MRLLIVGFALSGCSAESLKAAMGDAATEGSSFADTGMLAGEDAADEQEQPSHWTLSGSLDVADGEIDSTLSYVEAQVMGASGSTLCSGSIGVESAERVVEVPDDDVQIWWSISLGAAAADSCLLESMPDVIPDRFHLGLGPMHPEVEAVMDDAVAALGGADLALRSVFASLNNAETVWVFGVAGSEVSDEGGITGAPGDGGLVSEGRWKFHGLYGFPY